jgi:hypothetical protein
MEKQHEERLRQIMYTIISYTDNYELQWDKFIEEDAINGTFLQSRNFLNYHPKDRFIDNSFLFFKENKLAALIPGCIKEENGKKIFSSHAGSSFGGLVVHKKYYDASNSIEMIKTLESKLTENNFQEIVLKITPDLFCKESSDLLQYALRYCGYNSYAELSSYIDFEDYEKNIASNFSHGQRENLKFALKHEMQFEKLDSAADIHTFHDILTKNLLRFNAKPVHTIGELYVLKDIYLKNITDFYGVILDGKIIAGAMVFKFNGTTIHTQYLCMDYDYLKYRPMTYLYYKIIEQARDNGFKKLSWGISTEKKGTELNETLLAFKESVGSKYILNRGYYKTFGA